MALELYMNISHTVLLYFMSVLMCNASTVYYHGEKYDCHCENSNQCSNYTLLEYKPYSVCPSGCERGWFGPGCQKGNIAKGKLAVQAGARYPSIEPNLATNCNDGNTDSTGDGKTCCGVTGDRMNHWSVNLAGQYIIDSLTIHTFNKTIASFLATNIKYIYGRAQTQRCTSKEIVDGASSSFLTAYDCMHHLAKESIKIQGASVLMCEVVVMGYRYRECRQFQGSYFYGPGCLQNCHCTSQCHLLSGVCPLTCTLGYKLVNGICTTCRLGYWGADCKNACNCNNEHYYCNHTDGRCASRSGRCDSVLGECPEHCGSATTYVFVVLFFVLLSILMLCTIRKGIMWYRTGRIPWKEKSKSVAWSKEQQNDDNSICNVSSPAPEELPPRVVQDNTSTTNQVDEPEYCSIADNQGYYVNTAQVAQACAPKYGANNGASPSQLYERLEKEKTKDPKAPIYTALHPHAVDKEIL